jgi:hypothetical protein
MLLQRNVDNCINLKIYLTAASGKLSLKVGLLMPEVK